jgi:molecular chaperone HtpG
MFNLTVNANHPTIGKLLQQETTAQEQSVKQLVDLAMLAQGLLKGAALDAFIQRNIEHIA